MPHPTPVLFIPLHRVTSLTASCESTTYSDWIGAQLRADKGYFWSLTGDGSATALRSFTLNAFDANGTRVADDTGLMAFTPTVAGT